MTRLLDQRPASVATPWRSAPAPTLGCPSSISRQPVVNQVLQPGGHGQAGHLSGNHIDSTLIPSVWRTGRSQSAAARVDALASHGMDEIEIPAFLRNQAD